MCLTLRRHGEVSAFGVWALGRGTHTWIGRSRSDDYLCLCLAYHRRIAPSFCGFLANRCMWPRAVRGADFAIVPLAHWQRRQDREAVTPHFAGDHTRAFAQRGLVPSQGLNSRHSSPSPGRVASRKSPTRCQQSAPSSTMIASTQATGARQRARVRQPAAKCE